jgi:hypothetical protein
MCFKLYQVVYICIDLIKKPPSPVNGSSGLISLDYFFDSITNLVRESTNLVKDNITIR